MTLVVTVLGMTRTRHLLLPAVLLAPMLLAGCGDDPEPTAKATPSPSYAEVKLGVLCENVEATAVAADGTTLTCVYNQGKATWQMVTPSPSPSTTAPAAPVTTKPAPPPTPTIEEGIWSVGVDIPAGTYRVTEPVSDGCYWAITKSGTNGENIISNDNPSGGRPTVTLKKGQDFESSDCGTWRKMK